MRYRIAYSIFQCPLIESLRKGIAKPMNGLMRYREPVFILDLPVRKVLRERIVN